MEKALVNRSQNDCTDSNRAGDDTHSKRAAFLEILSNNEKPRSLDATASKCCWLGSLAISMTFLATPIAGVFCQRFGCRVTALLGAVMCIVGLVVTSFAKSLLLMYFTYGLLFGLGSCFIHTGSVFVVTMYFNKRRSLATSIFGASQSIGICAFAPMMQAIMDAVGWRNMYRIMAGAFGAVLFLVLTFDPNVEEPNLEQSNTEEGKKEIELHKGQEREVQTQRKEKKQKFTLAFFKVPGFVIALSALTIGTFGSLVTFVHLIKYCEEFGISAPNAANLFTIIGGTALVSSIVAGRLMDFKRVSPFHVNQVANITLAVSLLLLPQCFKYTHFIAFSVFYGVGFGAFTPTIYLLLLNNVRPQHRIYAFPIGETIISAGTLGGAPFAGFIADTTGSYVPAFYTFGSLLILAFLIVFPVYCFKLDKTIQTDESNREIGRENKGQSLELGIIPNGANGTGALQSGPQNQTENHVAQNHHGNELNANKADDEDISVEGVANEGLNIEEINTKF